MRKTPPRVRQRGPLHTQTHAPYGLPSLSGPGNQARQRFWQNSAALPISQPGDASEREADRVAARFMDGPAAMRHLPSATGHSSSANGSPLPAPVRAMFEPRLGQDLSGVRIHSNTEAAKSAHSLHAQAYTVGQDIFFSAGQYAPNTATGQKLLAHELTHVIQQRAGAKMIQRQLFPPIPIIVQPAQTVEVNAVDARQEPNTEWYKPWRYTGPLANFFRGDVQMTSIATMVTNVLAYLGTRNMDRLNIMDHGNQNGVEIGDDWLTSPADVTAHAGDLGRLRGRFRSGGFVHMQNCEAGQNRSLICALAHAFGVPVYAGTGLHNPLLGVNFGDYVRCDPNGTFNPNVSRPQALPPPPASA